MCALFGSGRDVSMFRRLNRELLGDIINQQCAFFKFAIDKTKANIYGEASGGRFYYEPVLFNCLMERDNQSHGVDDFGVNLERNVKFSLLRDDLVDANLVPEVGDILMYEEAYYEVDNVIENQYKLGKNPDYPNNTNPLNPGLENFGYDVSIICNTHMVPADLVNIINAR